MRRKAHSLLALRGSCNAPRGAASSGAELRSSRPSMAESDSHGSVGSPIGAIGIGAIPSSRSVAQIDVDGIKGQGYAAYRAESKKVKEAVAAGELPILEPHHTRIVASQSMPSVL